MVHSSALLLLCCKISRAIRDASLLRYSRRYTPAIGAEWFHFNHTIMKTPIISLREREAAIFAVLSHSPAAYAIYAHKRLGEKVGFSPTQVASALGGHVPEGLSEREEATYILARELSLMRGPLSDASFEKASNVLGKDGAAAVIHTTGSFLHLTILLNAADVPVPE